QGLPVESVTRLVPCRDCAVEAWTGGWHGPDETPVRVDHSGGCQCGGTNWPNPRMSAWPGGPRGPSVPVAQAPGQGPGDGRRGISANDPGGDFGRTDQQSPALWVPLQAQPEVVSDGPLRMGCRSPSVVRVTAIHSGFGRILTKKTKTSQ